jgi:hypothetical protein
VTCGFAGSRPAPSRRPRAVSSSCGVARRCARAQACWTARSTDLQFVPVLTSFFAAAHASFSAGRARLRHPTRAFTRGRPRHSTGCSGPDRSPSERSPGLPSSPSTPRHEVPGFGGQSVRPSGSRLGPFRRCCRGSPLVIRADRRVARLPSPSEPARGEPVDRRDVCCCRADPEGSESPFTPHRVPARCLRPRRGRDPRGRDNVESRQRQAGLGGDSGLRPDHSDREHGEPTRRRIAGRGQGGDCLEKGRRRSRA